MSRFEVYDVLDLSKYIITKCTNDKRPISNLQLQKILFYIQKAFLKKDKFAFVDNIEAWRFGPVVPRAYYRFCGYGAMPITETYETPAIEKEDKSIIDRIVEQKSALNPWAMVRETHKEGGAWEKTYDGGKGNKRVIAIEEIKEEAQGA